jgi:hypothetical protein
MIGFITLQQSAPSQVTWQDRVTYTYIHVHTHIYADTWCRTLIAAVLVCFSFWIWFSDMTLSS